jgi:hypothetical protein
MALEAAIPTSIWVMALFGWNHLPGMVVGIFPAVRAMNGYV